MAFNYRSRVMLLLVKTQHFLTLIRHNWNVQLAITTYSTWSKSPRGSFSTSFQCVFSGHMLQMNRGKRQSHCCVTSCVEPAWSAGVSLLRSILADHSSKPSPPASGWAFCHTSLVSRRQRRARQLLICQHWSAFSEMWRAAAVWVIAQWNDTHKARVQYVSFPWVTRLLWQPLNASDKTDHASAGEGGHNLKHIHSCWLKFLLLSLWCQKSPHRQNEDKRCSLKSHVHWTLNHLFGERKWWSTVVFMWSHPKFSFNWMPLVSPGCSF